MDGDLQSIVAREVSTSKHLLEQDRLRVFAYFEPPATDVDFGGLFNPQSFTLDFSAGTIALLWDQTPRFTSDIAVLGTFESANGIWRWPWLDNRFSSQLWAPTKNASAKLNFLEPYLAQETLKIEPQTAADLAGLINLQSDWYGHFEAAGSDGLTVFLSIKGFVPAADGPFCFGCFANRHDRKLLMMIGTPGLAYCDQCCRNVTDMLYVKFEHAHSLDDLAKCLTTASPSEFGNAEVLGRCCIICGATQQTFAFPHAMVCGGCNLIAANAIQGMGY